MDTITLLQAGAQGGFYFPTGKQFDKSGGKKPSGFNRTWSQKQVSVMDLGDLYVLLSASSARDDVIFIRGKFKGSNPYATRRTKKEFGAEAHNWVMLDIDDLPIPPEIDPTSRSAAEYVVSCLPVEFHNSSYVLHFSSSAGLRGQTAKMHIFFWFSVKVTDEKLKRYVKTLPVKVDASLYQPVQPHYICDPRFDDPDMDPFKGRPRLYLVEKKHASVEFRDRGREESPPRLKNIYKHGGDSSPAPRHQDGKLTDGREEFLRNLIWRKSFDPHGPFEDFVDAVYREFAARAETGPTSKSSNTYTYETVQSKCDRPEIRDRLRTACRDLPNIPDTYLEEEEAVERMHEALNAYFAKPEWVGIKATAGLGKSTAVRRILLSIEDLGAKFVEVYAPTLRLAQDWYTALKEAAPNADVRLVRGRSEKTCNKFDVVKEVAALGTGVKEQMCYNTKLGEKCEYYGKCAWSLQNPDPDPAIRIYTHSYLGQKRKKNDPRPDYIIIDENFFAEVHRQRSLPVSFLMTPKGLGGMQNRKVLGPHTSWTMSDCIEESECVRLYEVCRNIVAALQDGYPLLDRLRSLEITHAELERCAKIIVKLKVFPGITPGMSDERKKQLARGNSSQHLGSLGLLERMFRMLAVEIKLSRPHSVGVFLEEDEVRVCYKRLLPRLKRTPALILDADLEPEIFQWFRPLDKVVSAEVRYTGKIIQVSDKSFSKHALGLSHDVDDGKLRREVQDFLQALPNPEGTLIITYKALQEALTGEGGGFSLTPLGQSVGHFGAIRGVDDYKGFENIVVIGRFMPPDRVVNQIRRSMCFDCEDAESAALEAAIYRSIVHAETNQAVARLRMARKTSPKNVYVLSNEPVPFIVDEKVAWQDLLSGGSKEEKLKQRFGVVPLVPTWLHQNAPDLFSSSKAAEKWIATNNPPGNEDGTFEPLQRLGGKPRRYAALVKENVGYRLEQAYGPLRKVTGAEWCVHLDGTLWRRTNNDESFPRMVVLRMCRAEISS